MNRLIAAITNNPYLNHCSGRVAQLPLLGAAWKRIIQNPKELERFVKFAMVGALGAVVDFAVLNLMKRALEAMSLGVGWNVDIPAHQIQLAAANTVSFSTAVISNFTWNRLWTFPESRERPVGRQLVQFAIVNILGWVVNTALLLVLDRYVFQHYVSTRLSYNLAKAVAIGVVLFWNFGVNRVWTYRGIR